MVRRSLVSLVLLGLLSVPSFAYTVILKDGSRIQAKKKYRVAGKNAMITLINGSESFMPLSDIDVAATDKANQNDYGGTAVVLDEGSRTQTAPPPAAPSRGGSLADLIKSREVSTRLPEPSVRPPSSQLPTGGTTSSRPTPPRAIPGRVETTPKSNHRPYPNSAISDALAAYFRGQEIEDFRLFAGSRSGRVLVEATTASEASAFKMLTVAANALLELKSPEVAALELQMSTPGGERAGTFLITPEQATQLSTNKIEVSAFYVQNVQF